MRTSLLVPALILAVGMLNTPVAWASPVRYDFTLTVPNYPSEGPLAGTIANGSFSFDSSVIPTGGFGNVSQLGLFTDFSLTWNGTAYDQTTANTGSLGFGGYPFAGVEPPGRLTSFVFGNDCPNPGGGFSPNTCAVFSGTDTWRATGGIHVDPSTHVATFETTFFYAVPGTTGAWGIGTSSLSPGGPIVIFPASLVPEPSPLGLLITGIVLVGLVCRYRTTDYCRRGTRKSGSATN